MNLLILPGNPPALYFYERWKEEIESQHPQIRVRVAAYPEMAPTVDSLAAMKLVLDHHNRTLQAFHVESGGPITLLGHSLGGYFAWKMLENDPIRAASAILLYPFLRKPDLRGQCILKFARTVRPHEFVTRGILAQRKLLEKFSKPLSFVTDEELRKCVHLAAHEQATLAQNEDEVVVPENLRDRLRVFYTENDSWCTSKVVRELNSQVKAVRCSEPHDFVTKARYRQSLWQKIWQEQVY